MMKVATSFVGFHLYQIAGALANDTCFTETNSDKSVLPARQASCRRTEDGTLKTWVNVYQLQLDLTSSRAKKPEITAA